MGVRRSGGPGGVGSAEAHAHIPDPRYRSATEKRLCEEVMKKEGTWDEGTGSFRTRESVLQQRTQLITGMQQTLRVSPQLQYKYQSEDPACVYPQCPSVLLKNARVKAADLGVTDPRPENVERCMSTAMSRRSRAVKLPPSRVGTDEALAHLEEALLDEAHDALARMGAYTDGDGTHSEDGFRSTSAASLYAVGAPAGSGLSAARTHHQHQPHGSQQRGGLVAGNATPAMSRAPAGDGPTPLPVPTPPRAAPAGVDSEGYLADVGAAGPNHYSSLLMELRLTRQTAQERKKKHSALQAILDMEGSADLKRTITRMFADPKNAERISAEEAQRREARYAEDKQAQIRQQTRLLAEERAMMDKELAMLK